MCRRHRVFALETAGFPRLKVVFMGSDTFSVPSLEACLARTDVVAVYTQPDRRSGRGRKRIGRSPVKELAVDRGLHVEQPENFDKRRSEQLRTFGADLVVVAAYGHILPPAALDAARRDSVNVHASLLPRHRGAAPVAAAILAGDAQAGVTIMKIRAKLDAGEIVCCGERRRAQKALRIRDDETAGELTARLAALGGELLPEVLQAFADRSVTYETQDETQATIAPMLRKSDGRIDWTQPADRVARHVRAMTPWPGAQAELRLPGSQPVRMTVLGARPCEADVEGGPGRVAVLDGSRLVVSAGSGGVELLRVRPAGRKAMTAVDFLRGCSALREDSGQGGGCWFATA